MNEYIEELEDNIRDEADESRSDLDRNNLLSTASRLSAIKHGIKNVDPEMKDKTLYRKVNNHQVQFIGELPNNKSFSYRNVNETKLFGFWGNLGNGIIRGGTRLGNWWSNKLGNKGFYNSNYGTNSRVIGNPAIGSNTVQQLQNEFMNQYNMNHQSNHGSPTRAISPDQVKQEFNEFLKNKGVNPSNMTNEIQTALTNVTNNITSQINSTQGLNSKNADYLNNAMRNGTMSPDQIKQKREELLVDQTNNYQNINGRQGEINSSIQDLQNSKNNALKILNNSLSSPEEKQKARQDIKTYNTQLQGYNSQLGELDKQKRQAGFRTATGKVWDENKGQYVTGNQAYNKSVKDLVDRYNRDHQPGENKVSRTRSLLEKAGYKFDNNGNIIGNPSRTQTADNKLQYTQTGDRGNVVTNAAEFGAMTGNKIGDLDQQRVDMTKSKYETERDRYSKELEDKFNRNPSNRGKSFKFNELQYQQTKGKNNYDAWQDAEKSMKAPGARNIAMVNGQYVSGSRDNIAASGAMNSNIMGLGNTNVPTQRNIVDTEFGKKKPTY